MIHQNIRILAIIPARKGSKDIINNSKVLDGKPLIAYTIENANNKSD